MKLKPLIINTLTPYMQWTRKRKQKDYGFHQLVFKKDNASTNVKGDSERREQKLSFFRDPLYVLEELTYYT